MTYLGDRCSALDDERHELLARAVTARGLERVEYACSPTGELGLDKFDERGRAHFDPAFDRPRVVEQVPADTIIGHADEHVRCEDNPEVGASAGPGSEHSRQPACILNIN